MKVCDAGKSVTTVRRQHMNYFRLEVIALAVVVPALAGLVVWRLLGQWPKIGGILGVVLAAVASVFGASSFINEMTTGYTLPPYLPLGASAVVLCAVLAYAFGIVKFRATK
jgi:hypothetical protein